LAPIFFGVGVASVLLLSEEGGASVLPLSSIGVEALSPPGVEALTTFSPHGELFGCVYVCVGERECEGGGGERVDLCL
jgi:hypothetical protein